MVSENLQCVKIYCVCVYIFLCVLVQRGRGPFGAKKTEWWNICREKWSTSCLRWAACTGGFLSVRAAQPRWAGGTDRDTRWRERSSRMSSVFITELQGVVTKTSAGFMKTKRRVWFCLSGLCPGAGVWAVRFHGPSRSYDTFSKHSPPFLLWLQPFSRAYFLKICIWNISIFKSAYSCVCSLCNKSCLSSFKRQKNCGTWLTSSHLMLEWMCTEPTCLFSHSQSVGVNRNSVRQVCLMLPHLPQADNSISMGIIQYKTYY